MIESILWTNHWYEMNKGNPSFTIDSQDPLLNQRKILITGGINQISSREIVSKLLYLNHLVRFKDIKDIINLYLKTNGGWLDDAFSIINIMKSIKAPVNVYAMGGVQSAASLILISATGNRYAYEYSYISIHANRSEKEGYTQEQQFFRIHEEIWKKNTKIPAEWYPLTDNSHYFLTPEEAQRFDVIDSIIAIDKQRREKKK